MVIIYNLKEKAGKPHISTWHALFGLCAMILTSIQLIGGLPLVYSQVSFRYTIIEKMYIFSSDVHFSGRSINSRH